jgi:vacuolar-type H+-ATPase subunit E/Vma4
MALGVILGKIRASGEEQIQEVEQETRAQVNAVLAEAQMEAFELEEACATAASTPANAERARILHRAHLERLRVVGEVRENLVDEALARVGKRLETLRGKESYPRVLRRLIDEALAELAEGGADRARLRADPRDRALVSQILEALKRDLAISYELSCRGGLLASSEDGRVVVINTVEARLERATPFLRSHLAALFEEEESAVADLVHAGL